MTPLPSAKAASLPPRLRADAEAEAHQREHEAGHRDRELQLDVVLGAVGRQPLPPQLGDASGAARRRSSPARPSSGRPAGRRFSGSSSVTSDAATGWPRTRPARARRCPSGSVTRSSSTMLHGPAGPVEQHPAAAGHGDLRRARLAGVGHEHVASSRRRPARCRGRTGRGSGSRRRRCRGLISLSTRAATTPYSISRNAWLLRGTASTRTHCVAAQHRTASSEHRAQHPEQRDAAGLEGDPFAVAREAAEGDEQAQQERHRDGDGQGLGHEQREHPDDDRDRHALFEERLGVAVDGLHHQHEREDQRAPGGTAGRSRGACSGRGCGSCGAQQR